MGRVKWVLTAKGEDIADRGSPEWNLLQLVPHQHPGISLENLQLRLGDDFAEGFDRAMCNGWIIVIPIDGAFRTPRLRLTDDRIRSLCVMISKGQKLDIDDERLLRRRKLITMDLV